MDNAGSVENFTGRQRLDVNGHITQLSTGKHKHVSLSQYSGSMSFSFTMTTDQAVALMIALNKAVQLANGAEVES